MTTFNHQRLPQWLPLTTKASFSLVCEEKEDTEYDASLLSKNVENDKWNLLSRRYILAVVSYWLRKAWVRRLEVSDPQFPDASQLWAQRNMSSDKICIKSMKQVASQRVIGGCIIATFARSTTREKAPVWPAPLKTTIYFSKHLLNSCKSLQWWSAFIIRSNRVYLQANIDISNCHDWLQEILMMNKLNPFSSGNSNTAV